MRMLKMFLVALGCVVFTSCLEIKEDVEINENGSGQIASTLDLAQLIDMMQAMGGEEFEKRKDEKIDSTISMKAIIDTAKNLSAAQKDLMRDGKVSIKMNMAEKEFRLSMQFPFTSMERLQQLNIALAEGSIGLTSFMKDAMGGEKDNAGSDQPEGAQAPDVGQMLGVFDYNYSNGLIKKTVNPEKLKKMMDDPKLAEVKQGADMGIEVPYNVTYKLPRPAKKVDNPAAKLSDDKKTVTIRTNLLELFTKPDQFAYTIEY